MIPIFRFHPEDFREGSVKRHAVLREYNIYKPVLNQTLSPMELTQIEIMVNELNLLCYTGSRYFVLKDSNFEFYLYLTRFSPER